MGHRLPLALGLYSWWPQAVMVFYTALVKETNFVLKKREPGFLLSDKSTGLMIRTLYES